ncbi:hypothetical protein ACROYT_G015058 [Oculina patagonica]
MVVAKKTCWQRWCRTQSSGEASSAEVANAKSLHASGYSLLDVVTSECASAVLEANKKERSDPAMRAESSNTEKGLTLQSAKNAVCVTFNVTSFSDIVKEQMMSAVKQLKVKCSITSSTKEELVLALALAEIFIK